MSEDLIYKVGAAYAAVQILANAVMIVMGEKRNNTIVYKLCKLLVSGPRRAPAPFVDDADKAA